MAMRLSPFRPGAPKAEKLYLALVLSWIALVALGWVYYFFKGVHFGPEPRFVPLILGVSLLCGVLCWYPVTRDPNPNSVIASHSFPVRIGLHATLIVAFTSLAMGTYFGVIGPLVTHSLGTPRAGAYVVTDKSSGRADRRSCNHFIWLREIDSQWRAKVCLSRQVWDTARVGVQLNGTGRSSLLGRTLENLDWGAAKLSLPSSTPAGTNER